MGGYVSPFADTALAVHEMCVAGDRPDAPPGLRAFARSNFDDLGLTVHEWKLTLPPEPPTISHERYCYHESLCHLTWPG